MYVIDNLIYSLAPITLYLSNYACSKVSDLQRRDRVACGLLKHKLPQKKHRYVYIYSLDLLDNHVQVVNLHTNLLLEG